MKSLWTLILLALLASCNDELKEQQVAFDNLKQQSMERMM
ncbi:hypothetical protein JCM19296_452 [Nonlabens ulvanivorans]|uniref:Uncharacterized protein n=1 Tax=Nonlabens ulvanivorans TaxID=906888 RepID=A0A081D7H8_NONUL|nr:hypothetical protein JCM19296_452 [Nonlabens ulvanivorans]